MSLSISLCEEYFKIEREYCLEYNKENLCVLYAIGSFYDMLEYNTLNEEENNYSKLSRVSNLLNVMIGGKKNNEKDLPNFIGFPKIAISKYLPLLIDNGYTVVLVDENKVDGKIHRTVSGVYSSSVYPIHIIDTNNDCDLMNVTIELYNDIKTKNIIAIYNIAVMNTFTNLFHVYNTVYLSEKSKDIFNLIMDNIYRIKLRYNVNEYIFHIYNKTDLSFLKENFNSFLDIDLSKQNVYFKDISEVDYKKFSKKEYLVEFFENVYKHIDIGLLDIFERLNISSDLTIKINCLLLLQFVSRHDLKYIENISIPTLVNEYNHLLLESNTLQQLNIIPYNKTKVKYGSLYDVLNKTSTILGKRGLLKLLTKPYVKYNDILNRYKLTDELLSVDLKKYEILLDQIFDIERLYRKMTIGVLHPYEFCNLDKSLNKIIELNDFLHIDNCNLLLLNKNVNTKLVSIIEKYNKIFIIDNLKYLSLNENSMLSTNSVINPFILGVNKSIDSILNTITDNQLLLEDIKTHYESLICGNGDWIKITYSDNDGYYLQSTKIRLKLLEKKLDPVKFSKLDIKNNTSTCKISSKEIRDISNTLVNSKILLLKQIKNEYLNIIKGISYEFSDIFRDILSFVETLDITKSNIKCKNLYKYCKPEIIIGDSMIDAKALRHPIIERINTDFEYIPNDILLNKDNNGIILYALNSCGKSSLLRSIGLNLIMAQCGLYVACDSFKFSPFESVITQVDLNDNMWKSQSSFINEMIGLKKIINLANDKCLILSDELTKGTEVVSATSIFSSSVLSLIERKSKFVFTTHLQDVSKLNIIQSCSNIRICHLSVDFDPTGNIIFERKLKNGPCSELYGLEVAKSIGLDTVLLDRAFDIRRTLINKRDDIYNKYSKYNSTKLINKCELCSYKPIKNNDLPLDVHHIKFQCNSDSSGFNGHFHKNSKFNLVCLCKTCHINVHNENIIINGYKNSINGKILDFYNVLKK